MDTDTLTPDVEEQAMRDLGVETDAAQGREPVEDAVQTPPEPLSKLGESPTKPDEPPSETQNADETPPEPEPTEGQQLGRDIKTGQFKKAEKPETEYSKAQKEQVRINRTWQNIQAEKEQIRTEKAQWEEHVRMQQLEAARQQYQPLKKDGLTAQEYYEGAQRFEQEGDHENALKAYKVASELGRTEQQRYAQFQEMDAEYQWRVGMQQLSKANPEFFDNSKPLGAHLERLIAQHGDTFYRMPEGIMRAAEIANMLTHEGLLKEKDDEIIALKAELEKHQRKGQPAKGGFASPRTGEKDFDEMNLDEQEAHLRHMTAEADSWR